MSIKSISLVFPMILLLAVTAPATNAQGTVPTFTHVSGQSSYTFAGGDPERGSTTTIPTVLVPVTLSFDAKKTGAGPFVMDSAADVPSILRSPLFSNYGFPSGGTTQYTDAMLRATFPKAEFPKAEEWHTLLGKPEVKPVKITVPVGYGYILTSKKTKTKRKLASIVLVSVADTPKVARMLPYA